MVEESRIAGVHFEVATEVNLEKGTLVFCRQGEVKVFYQILDATTTEESFEKNPFGSHRASAVQLGVLDSEEGFVKYPWLPAMNCPVFLARDLQALKAELDDDQLVLGTVPGTRLEVRARFSELLEYHTAVLGVTGTGKTEFVYDIIRHGLRTGAKIFCVDFTAEYRERLSDLNPELLGFDAAAMDELEALILGVETGDFAAGREKEALEDWVRASRPGTEGRVDGFLRAEGPGLGIFELPEIANTRATLRATELYLSAIFNWARKHRRARPILVVLEEAHTVIPEMTLFQRDRADSYAVVGRMSQIALQGRKFGVGLLLISQRTALVSKTLLSQCNTCFSFAMYDKTGLEYLSTIYGKEHVEAVPNLSFLQCIGFGKAVLSDRPILFKLPYEQAKKEASEALRRAVPPDEILEEAPSQPDEEPRNQTLPSPDDDDIPF